MLKDLFAVVVLLLAISPLTAPFQTCDAGKAIVIAAVNPDDDPGTLVAPVAPKTSHVLIAPLTADFDAHNGLWAARVPSRVLASRVQRPPLRPIILRI